MSQLKMIELDSPSNHPCNSTHWKHLKHKHSDKLLNNLDELRSYFKTYIQAISNQEENERNDQINDSLAIWSCIVGYCEALTTHKDSSKRFSLFPIPIDALCRLVTSEFKDFVQQITRNMKPNFSDSKTSNKKEKKISTSLHRDTAKTISNGIWAQVLSKPSARDELHSNSLYVALRGNIDKKTLDCFGATVVTIAGLHMLGIRSFLTLSEDHAYETHYEMMLSDDGQSSIAPNQTSSSFPTKICTCELAVPGNTKISQAKRGNEISMTFTDKSELTPQKSWLYMGAHPVICTTLSMAIAAVISNVTCLIEYQRKNRFSIVSRSLFEMKRDLLWVLKDEGHLSKFPYAMMELGDCEEHTTSKRGESWINIPELGGDILMIESLYHEAISVSRSLYGDRQVYPYCCK